MSRARKHSLRKSIGRQPLHPETLMMSYGYEPQLSEGAVKCPIFQTSTFVFKTAEEGKAFFELAYGLRERGPREEPGLIYSRINNPDLQILEERLTLWDGAEEALTFSSGMAAISTTLFALLKPGDVIVHSDPVYGGTDFLIERILPQFGITGEPYGAHIRPLAEAIAAAEARGPVAVIFIETPANPTNQLFDVAAARAAALDAESRTGRRPIVIVDNTVLGPLWQQPLPLGADLVIYSLTKYVGGHSDVIAGACLGSEADVAPVRGMRTIMGTMCSPHTGWLLMRSLETLKLRMTSAMKNARYIAEFLNEHPRVAKVDYLGFLADDDPQHAIYQRQCKAPGSTFSFEIHGGEAEAFRLLNALQLVRLAVSLGGTESLMEHPATMTHADIPPARQLAYGITPAMLRLSVGVEHPEDVIADLAQALDAI